MASAHTQRNHIEILVKARIVFSKEWSLVLGINRKYKVLEHVFYSLFSSEKESFN